MGFQIEHVTKQVTIEARMLVIPVQLNYDLHQKTNLVYWPIDKSKVFLDNHLCEISQLEINTNDINNNHQNIKI